MQLLLSRPRPPCRYWRCDKLVPTELRPGRPRQYCGDECARDAANERRPASPKKAELEKVLHVAQQKAEEARAELEKAVEAAEAARAQADEVVSQARRQLPTYSYSLYRTPDESLAMVDSLFEAHVQHEEYKTDKTAAHFSNLFDQVKKDHVANRELEAREAAIRLENAQTRAESAAKEVAMTTAALNDNQQRLDRRAAQARRRRADKEAEAQVQPQELHLQEVHQIDIDHAREDPEYRAWLHSQGYL